MQIYITQNKRKFLGSLNQWEDFLENSQKNPTAETGAKSPRPGSANSAVGSRHPVGHRSSDRSHQVWVSVLAPGHGFPGQVLRFQV